MIPSAIALYAPCRSNSCALTWQFVPQSVFICTVLFKVSVCLRSPRWQTLFIHIQIGLTIMSGSSSQHLKSPQVIENECFRAGPQLISSPRTNVPDLRALFVAPAPVGVQFMSEKWRTVTVLITQLWPLSILSKRRVCSVRDM